MMVARRYAQAYINLYHADLTPDDVKRFKEVERFFDTHPHIISLLKIALIAPGVKISALKDILITQFKLPLSLERLIHLLVKNRRSFLIKDVVREIAALYQEREGYESFIISSSMSLAAQDVELLAQYIARNTGHTMLYEYHLDPSLIAGIRIQSNYTLWEHSVAKYINALSHLSVTG